MSAKWVQVVLLVASGCGAARDGSTSSGATSATSTTGSGSGDTDTTDTDTGDDGVAEYCASLTRAECIAEWESKVCFPVTGCEVTIEPGRYCLSDSEVYLGCIDAKDIGCGVWFACKDDVMFEFSVEACTPPGYEPCEPGVPYDEFC